MAPPRSIAVLGGGISGLSAAFYLLQRFKVPVTLIEGTRRVGGWIQSSEQLLSSEAGGSVVLEGGPRTLRPSQPLLELVSPVRSTPPTRLCSPKRSQLHLTGISDLIREIPKGSPASRNRFVHILGTSGLMALPATPRAAIFSRLGRRMFLYGAVDFGEDLDPLRQADDDQSVEAYLARRAMGSIFDSVPEVPLLASALMHGIYAADARQLSARAVLGDAYLYGSPTKLFLIRMAAQLGRGRSLPKDMQERLTHILGEKRKASESIPPYTLPSSNPTGPFSLHGGTSSLTAAVFNQLDRQARFQYVPDTHVTALRRARTGDGVDVDVLAKDAPPKTLSFSHVVSSLPLHNVSGVLPHPIQSEAALRQTPYSTVTVVNLVFPRRADTEIHPEGFGYLVPRPIDGYTSPQGIEENLGVLGVIFDSCIAPQDPEVDKRVVRLTVMLGGPYYAENKISEPQLALPQLLAVLSRQLGLATPLQEPIFAQASHLSRCIPTPTVGHMQRVDSLRRAVKKEFGGRLEIIGAAVSGVSVGDCIGGGREAGLSWLPK